MKNKWNGWLVCFLVFLCGICRADVEMEAAKGKALEGALARAAQELPGEMKSKSVAVLPILQDPSGSMTGKVKNMLTGAGLICLEGKEDPMWEEILKEIAWDERKDDILEESSLVKFGQMKAVQVLVYGKVSALDANEERVYAEVELHATDVATRRHIWGGTFVCRQYLRPDVKGLVSLSPELRKELQACFDAGKDALLSADAAAKLSGIRTVTVVPLAGDIDRYMTSLAVTMVNGTAMVPRLADATTLSYARLLLQDGSIGTDAILYGAIRDLSEASSDWKSDLESKEKSRTLSQRAEVQLFLEEVKTGNIVWSRTLSAAHDQPETAAMTTEEVDAAVKGKIKAVPVEVVGDAAAHWKSILKWIGIGIGGIVLLVVVAFVIRGLMGNVFIRG